VLRRELTVAMRGRDRPAISAIRTALAAIANAEAPPIDAAPTDVHGRLSEHARIELAEADAVRIVRQQIDDRVATLAEIDGRGRDADADVLRAEASVLNRIVDAVAPPS